MTITGNPHTARHKGAHRKSTRSSLMRIPLQPAENAVLTEWQEVVRILRKTLAGRMTLDELFGWPLS